MGNAEYMGNLINLILFLTHLQMKFFALVAAVAANTYDFMGEDELLSQLSSTLEPAQRSEARGDGDPAVAKTAAIKNIQKALTARILKRLDDGQPLVEVARKKGHRRNAATNQRYGKKTWYHAIRRASTRERHQDPPKGRRCQRYGQEMSTISDSQIVLTIMNKFD